MSSPVKDPLFRHFAPSRTFTISLITSLFILLLWWLVTASMVARAKAVNRMEKRMRKNLDGCHSSAKNDDHNDNKGPENQDRQRAQN